MIIVQLLGGLGNQMFQYALGRRLSYEQQIPLMLDDVTHIPDTARRYSLDCFNFDAIIASSEQVKSYRGQRPDRKLHRWLTRQVVPYTLRSVVKERTPYHYDSDVILNKSRMKYLVGYWQTELYFKPIEAIIRQDFTWRYPLDSANEALAQQIMSVEAVSLHIRRGDYASNPATNQFHGLLPLSYYAQAANTIAAQVSEPHFFAFSDDPAWTKANLKLPYPLTVVEHNGSAGDDADMRLMSLCRHHIIANSSFSWWGAWLADFPDKIVYAPKQWLNDPTIDTTHVTPPGWHRI